MTKKGILKIAILIGVLLAIYSYQLSNIKIFADEIDDIQSQINGLKNQYSQLDNTKKLDEQKLISLRTQLNQVKKSLQVISSNIDQKGKELKDKDTKLADQQILLQQRIKSYYISSYLTNPILIIFSSQNPAVIFQDLAYRQATAREDQLVIKSVTGQIIDLKDQKNKLEKDKASLASLQSQVNKNAALVDSEIQQAQSQQATINNQIASLSAKQQQLIAAKLASLNLPTVASSNQTACINDRTVNPGFSPRFALYSFGVNNHIGLNQYGAKGRADAGQTYDQILSAYFTNYSIVKQDTSSLNITVNGYNPDYNQTFNNEVMNIETYVKHLYEMPASWPSESLKAQAIAARTYALATTANATKPVCPSQSCQVVKHEINSPLWQAAVDATQGMVMISKDNGAPITAWFSAVHGGYVYTSADVGWSPNSWTKNAVDGTSTPTTLADMANTSYDKSAPWFYCDWGGRSQYKGTAWLNGGEFADIVNVVQLAKLATSQGDTTVTQHLSQLDKPNPDGVDTWNPDRVRQELKNRGGSPYNSVTAATISWNNTTGKTTSVQVSGDVGVTVLDSGTFKSYFNLRAPANIQIVSPLFNIEIQ